MDIQARIRARKLVLTYFYLKLFVRNFWEKESLFEEIFQVEKDMLITVDDKEKKKTITNFKNYYSSKNWENDIDYLLENFFKKEAGEGIDMDYVKIVVPFFDKYEKLVWNAVNKNSDTFKFEEMDLIDRAIFILWYIENKKIQTPKNVVLNEMIELAKRYGDEGSFKLINWIWHNIIKDVKE